MLTYQRVRDLFNYDRETGNLIWRVDKSVRAKAGDASGYIEPRGYRMNVIDGKKYMSHRVVWLWHKGYLPENYIDHINRDKGDNRIENLREVSPQCNVRNSGNYSSTKSGVKGVFWYKAYGKWRAIARVFGKRKYLGDYLDFDDAVCARLAAEQCLNWEGCDSCSPAYQYVRQMLRKE